MLYIQRVFLPASSRSQASGSPSPKSVSSFPRIHAVSAAVALAPAVLVVDPGHLVGGEVGQVPTALLPVHEEGLVLLHEGDHAFGEPHLDAEEPKHPRGAR
jgi:hypothetical protein